MMRTLFLQAPSFDGFDGGAGSRYQAKREIKSFWYPTWLAQPAALIEGSKLVDAPAHGLPLADVAPLARDFDLAVLHTSTPSFAADVGTVEALKSANPRLKVGLIGAKVAVDAEGSLRAAPVVDFVARNEFDFTIREVAEDRDWSRIAGLSYRNRDGVLVHNADRPVVEDMDSLPFVTPVYKRDLVIENYFIGYLRHPYVSLYTGRGCKSRCTFCLWPQTVGGHRYRTRSVGHVSGNQQILHNIKKGMRVEVARRFTRDCHDLGITIHGTLTLGLPGETRETIQETIRFAREINPHTIQVSLAAPYPGTALHRQALENGWLDDANAQLVNEEGVQIAPLHYPHLSHTEIFQSVEAFYRSFYFRAGKIASIMAEMAKSPEMLKRRLREGVEFFRFLRERRAFAESGRG